MAFKREKPMPARDWTKVANADVIEGAIIELEEKGHHGHLFITLLSLTSLIKFEASFTLKFGTFRHWQSKVFILALR